MATLNILKENGFWKNKFKHAMKVQDADKDGFISQADFEVIIKRHETMGTPQPHLEKLKLIFKKSTATLGLTDKITVEEYEDKYFKYLEAKEAKKLQAEVFKEKFDELNIDGDEVISLHEWITYYKSLGIDPIHAKPSFTAMDVSRDGKVSKQEFVNYHMEFFFTAEDRLKSSILYGPLPQN